MSVTTRQEILDRLHAGKGAFIQYDGLLTGATTSSNSASGNHTLQVILNTIGSTLWSSLVGINLQSGISDPLRLTLFHNSSTRATTHILVRLYKLGTVDLTTSTSEFTHDSATFPVLRTVMGQASQPIELLPIILLTTATTTTPAVLSMNYTDQDGNSVTGTKTLTLPAAATAVGSCYMLPLEEGDSGVRDVTDIVVTTPAGAGAASIYGVEIIAFGSTISTSVSTNKDSLHRGFSLPSMTPAVPTSGTLTSLGAILQMGQSATTTASAMIQGFYDN